MTATPLHPTPAKLYLCKSLLDSPLGSSTICSKLKQVILSTQNTSFFCISNLEEWNNCLLIVQERELKVILSSFLPPPQWHFSLSQSSDLVGIPYSHLSIFTITALVQDFIPFLPDFLMYNLSSPLCVLCAVVTAKVKANMYWVPTR